jgi:hypothetical protein
MIKRDDCKLNNWARCATPIIVAVCFLTSLRVAAASPPTSVDRDLTPRIVHHEARCPSPGQGKCVIRKPVGSGYRVLTPGLELEDAGDHWIGDFSRTRNAKPQQTLLRIMDRHEVLHEIEITFPNESGVSEAPAADPAAAGKSALEKRKPAKSKAKAKSAKKQAPAAPPS